MMLCDCALPSHCTTHVFSTPCTSLLPPIALASPLRVCRNTLVFDGMYVIVSQFAACRVESAVVHMGPGAHTRHSSYHIGLVLTDMSVLTLQVPLVQLEAGVAQSTCTRSRPVDVILIQRRKLSHQHQPKGCSLSKRRKWLTCVARLWCTVLSR